MFDYLYWTTTGFYHTRQRIVVEQIITTRGDIRLVIACIHVSLIFVVTRFLKSVNSLAKSVSPIQNGHSSDDQPITDDEQALYTLLLSDFNVDAALEKKQSPPEVETSTGW